MSENRVRFDRFVLDRERRQLFENDTVVHLTPKAFRLLDLLIESRPRALSKEEIHEDLWPDVFVSEVNLASLISELRAILSDSARSPRFIRTVHGFGYSFCGEARAVPEVENRIRGVVTLGAKEITLWEEISVIGRDAENAVTVDDSTVSRRHASLRITADGASIEDLGSKNGTFVRGVRIVEPTPIRDGEEFAVGGVHLVFRLVGSATSTVTLHGI